MQINESQNIIAFLGCKLNQNKYDVYGWIDLVNKTVEIRYTETSYGNNLHMERILHISLMEKYHAGIWRLVY